MPDVRNKLMKKHHKLAARKRIQKVPVYDPLQSNFLSAIELVKKIEDLEKEFARAPVEVNHKINPDLLNSSLFTEEFI
jgi:hypothetical protein